MDPFFVSQIVLLLILIFLSAFFSGSETALYAIEHTTLLRWKRDGSKYQKLAARLMDDHHATLIAILIGTNFVNILASVILNKLTGRVLSGPQSVLIAGLVATTVIVIFGEVAPKTFAYGRSQSLAPRIAPIIRIFCGILSPVILVIKVLTGGLLRLTGPRGGAEAITAEEFHTFINMGRTIGAFPQVEVKLLEEILDLSRIPAVRAMVPRVDVLTVDVSWDVAKVSERTREGCHRRLPVVDGGLDNVMGILDVRTFVMSPPEAQRKWPRACVCTPIYVPEQASLSTVLSRLRQADQGLCFVVDEYGGISGLITVEDIIEEVVGEMADEYDEPSSEITQIRPDRWRLSGLVQLSLLRERIDISLPETASDTVGGLITERLGRIPKAGDSVDIDRHQFTVGAVYHHRVVYVDLCIRGPGSV